MTVIISHNLVIDTSQSGLLDNARIGHASFTLNDGVTVTASSEDATFTADSLLNPLTYERWLPLALPATAVIDLGSDAARAANYVGIAAHTLGTCRATITVASSPDNVTWTDLQSIAPGNNAPIMLLFGSLVARYWRLTVEGDDAIPYVGVFYVGQALTMQRRIYGGVQSPLFNFDTKVITNRSNTGQTLGRTIVRSAVPQQYQWRHLTRDWVENNIPQFLEDARERAFFVAWRPSTHPDDVVYGELENDPQLSNMGIRDFLDMSLKMRGVVNE